MVATPKFGGFLAADAPSRGAAVVVPVQLAFGLRSLNLVDEDAELRRRLAYAITAAMTAKGWKAPDLARAINRDPSTVSRWADGTNAPSFFMVKPLAAALDVRPEFLYDPPPVPNYPLSEYLVRAAGQAAVAEGARRPRRARGAD